MKTTIPIGLLAVALSGCSSGQAVVDKNTAQTGPTDCVEVVGGADCNTGTATGGGGGGGTGTGSGTTAGIDTWVGDEDPGSGPGGELYLVEALVDADREDLDGGGYAYVTDMRVEVFDDQGQPLSGLEVHLDALTTGDTLLAEDPGNPGRYEATTDAYARTYTLRIEPADPQASFEAQAVGPEPHVFIDWEPEPWDIAGADPEVRWAPTGADHARIDTRGTGGIDIDDDGLFALPADQLDQEAGEIGEERVRLRRGNLLDLTGALPGSWMDIRVEIERDPVDTTDSRVGSFDGTVTLDPQFADLTGDVYVLAWPDALEPGVDAPAAWTQIPDGDFTDFGTWMIDTLEPGDWFLLAYLDADGSDIGLPAPDGPTDGDPFDDTDRTIDPNQSTSWDAVLDQTWQGW